MLEQRSRSGHLYHQRILEVMDQQMEKSCHDVHRFRQLLAMGYYDLQARQQNDHHDVALVFVNHIRQTEKIVRNLRFILTDREGYYFWNASTDEIRWDSLQIADSLEECTKERFDSLLDIDFIKECFAPPTFLSTMIRLFYYLMV